MLKHTKRQVIQKLTVYNKMLDVPHGTTRIGDREGWEEDSLAIAHCRNVRALGRVSYIDYTENLKIKTEMLMNEKLPDQV